MSWKKELAKMIHDPESTEQRKSDEQKVWTKPQLQRMSAGSAENGLNTNPDGTDVTS